MVRQGVLTAAAGRRPAAPAAVAWLAAAVAVAAYIGALDNPFVYDDHDTVVANPSLREPRSLRYILGYSLFRPLVNASYAIDYAVWGLQPFGYHLTNLALHALAVWLLHRVVWRVVEDRNGPAIPRLPAAGIAAAVSLLWGVHPLLSEAVAYVSGRSELLASVGVLGALLLFRRGILGGASAAYVGAAAAFALALASKETAAMLPFLLLLWDGLLLRPLKAGFRRRLVRLHAPLTALVVAAGAVRLWTLLSAEAGLLRGPWENLLLQARVIPRYAGLTLVPSGQTIMHGVVYPSGRADPVSLAALVAIGAAVVVAWRARRAEPLVPFGLIWFLLLLAPSSTVIALREPMAEHRAYLASAGLVLACVGAAARWRPVAAAGARALAPPAAILFALTVARTEVWGDPVRLWTESAAREPLMWEPHYLLGDALRERGRCAEAADAYRRVVELRPGHRDARNNLGICLAELGQTEEAREAFEAALAIDPSFARAHANLGNVALMRGDARGAREHFLAAIASDPKNVIARRQLVAMSEATGDHAEAVRYCHELAGIVGMTAELAGCIERNEAALRSAR